MTYEVGQFYKVPCVRAQYFRVVDDWPVTGPQHDDIEFVKFEYQHFHIDWRFVPPKRFNPLGFQFGAPLMTSSVINPAGLPKPVQRRRKMYRQLRDFSEVRWRAKWFPKLEDAYAACRLKPGLVCPHKGIPLAGVHQDGDVATCPAHGLRWNVKTGELVRRNTPPTPQRGSDNEYKQELVDALADLARSLKAQGRNADSLTCTRAAIWIDGEKRHTAAPDGLTKEK